MKFLFWIGILTIIVGLVIWFFVSQGADGGVAAQSSSALGGRREAQKADILVTYGGLIISAVGTMISGLSLVFSLKDRRS